MAGGFGGGLLKCEAEHAERRLAGSGKEQLIKVLVRLLAMAETAGLRAGSHEP